MEELRSLLSNKSVDVLGISETWAKSHVTNKSISIEDYSVYRNDRPVRRGGGVCLYIRKQINVRVLLRSNGEIEYLFVRIKYNGIVILLGIIYRPPSSEPITHLPQDALNLISQHQYVVLMGDFNHNLADQSVLNMSLNFWNTNGLHLVHNGKFTHFDSHHNSSSLIHNFIISDCHKLIHSNQFWLPNIGRHAFIYLALDYVLPLHMNTTILVQLIWKIFWLMDPGGISLKFIVATMAPVKW